MEVLLFFSFCFFFFLAGVRKLRGGFLIYFIPVSFFFFFSIQGPVNRISFETGP